MTNLTLHVLNMSGFLSSLRTSSQRMFNGRRLAITYRNFSVAKHRVPNHRFERSSIYLLRWNYSKSTQERRLSNHLDPNYKVQASTKRSDFATINATDIEVFRWQTDGRIVTDKEDLAPYNVDWLNSYRGKAGVVLKPKTTEEISNILAYCNERNLAVVPQAGNTGLVGGSVPIFDEVILSTSLMNKVINLDRTAGILTCEAGCVLEDLSNYLAEYGLMMPLDLGAKGSCQIGGNVSTNAGGLRVLRYGSLHGSVLGIEAVLADGTVLDCLTAHRKDNTGYDLKQLFIGAEGTLGVITKVAISVAQLPKNVSVSFVGCTSFDNVKRTFVKAKEMLGEVLSAFELLDDAAVSCAEENLGLRKPISTAYPFYVLVETSGSNEKHDEEKLTAFLEELMEDEIAVDGTVTNDPGKVHAIWNLRESIATALMKDGKCYKDPYKAQPFLRQRKFERRKLAEEKRREYDISLPLSHFYDIVEELRAKLPPTAKRIVGYGHVGDGNLHLNVVAPHEIDFLPLLEPFIYEWTSKYGGSISAEHGLGHKKAKFIHYSKTNEAVEMMKRVKKLFDPKGILNPYKTILVD